MEKFLNIIFSVLILFIIFVGMIYTFALCLPIILVMVVLYFLKQKTKNK